MISWLLPFQVDGKHLAMGVMCCHKGRERVNLDFVLLTNSVSTMHCAPKMLNVPDFCFSGIDLSLFCIIVNMSNSRNCKARNCMLMCY